MKTHILSVLILFLLSGFTHVNYVFAEQFSDVPYGFWAYKEIESTVNNHYMTGYSDGKFLPNKLVTRAEYATMIVKIIGKENMPIEEVYSFDDINSSHWAWKYVIRAVNLDILLPVEKYYFCPDDYITRTDVITFLVNILKSEDITKKDALFALQNAYDDFDDIPDWFKVTAGKAEVLGVIPKNPSCERIFDVNQYVTRSDMAVFLYKLKEKIDLYSSLEGEKQIKNLSPKVMETGIVIENVIQSGDVATIQSGTVLPIAVIGGISSKTSDVGQIFNAKFPDNILDDKKQLLLSKDIILTGKILEAEKAIPLLNNGELFIEISGANNEDVMKRIQGLAQFDVHNINANKFTSKVLKGKNFEVKDGQIVYFKLYAPMRVNLVTGEILD